MHPVNCSPIAYPLAVAGPLLQQHTASATGCRLPPITARFARQSGFSLLEVIVALALLAIAYPAFFGLINAALSRNTQAIIEATAADCASSRLAGLESGRQPLADSQGQCEEETLSWHLETTSTADNQQGPAGLVRATLRVQAGTNTPFFTLTALLPTAAETP